MSRRTQATTMSYARNAAPASSGAPYPAEARLVATTRAAQNFVLKNAVDAAEHTRPRQPAPISMLVNGRHAAWLGTPLGEGAYGMTFTCRVDADTFRALETARGSSTFWVDYRTPKIGETVVIKLTQDKRRSDAHGAYTQFVADNLKEASWHRYLDRAPCVQLGAFKPVCAAVYVPDFYWSGLVVDSRTRARVYMTVMGLARGVTIQRHLSRNRLTADLFLRIERAMASLWLSGIAHADLHKDNMLYDASTGYLTIIDFGMGVLLPPTLTTTLRTAVARAIGDGVRSLGEVWRKGSSYGVGVQRHVNRVMRGRGFSWYNPDGYAAMRLFSMLSASDRRMVPSLRKTMWTSGTGQAAVLMAQRPMPPMPPMPPGTSRTPRTPRTPSMRMPMSRAAYATPRARANARGNARAARVRARTQAARTQAARTQAARTQAARRSFIMRALMKLRAPRLPFLWYTPRKPVFPRTPQPARLPQPPPT